MLMIHPSPSPRPLGAEAPTMIPDPRESDAAAKAFLQVWGDWSDRRERLLQKWGSDIDDLIKMRAATCSEIDRYNRAAISLLGAQATMRIRLIKSGAENVAVPPFPTLFAEVVQVGQPAPGVFRMAYKIPCVKGARYPDFSKMKVWGKQTRVAGASTPIQTAGLAGLPALIIPWAGRIIFTLALGAAAGFVIIQFRKLFSDADVRQIHAEILAKEAERDSDRAAFVKACVEKSDGSPAAIDACNNAGAETFPPRDPEPTDTGGLGKFFLFAGLATLLVFGGLTLYTRAKAQD